jgi:Zn-dependent protease
LTGWRRRIKLSKEQIVGYLTILPIFLVSLTVHEYAHGWVAYKCGDDTAKRLGRLTLNPLAHITLFGTIIMPLIAHFGWAKPVPVNFAVLTKKEIFKVAAAGPAANILLAITLAGIFHLFGSSIMPAVGSFILFAIYINLILATFNLLPIPPLDGSKMVYTTLKSPTAIKAYMNYARYGMVVFIVFIVVFKGFRLFLPVVWFVYRLLMLPLPAL